MTGINQPTAHSSSPTTRTRKPQEKKASTSKVRKAGNPPHKVDQSRLSQEAGLRPNQVQTPNFQSWANPNSTLKPLTGGNLARRDQGENVKRLQQHLNQNGAKLETDGKFGPLTQNAVRQFQRDHKLEVDGIVGPQTRGALNQGLSAQTPSPAKTPEAGAKTLTPARAPEPAKRLEPAAKKPESAPQTTAPARQPEPTAKAPEPTAKAPEPAAKKPEPASKTTAPAKAPEPTAKMTDPAKKPEPAAQTPQVQQARGQNEQSGLPNFASWAAGKPEAAAAKRQLPPGSYNAAQVTPEQLSKLKQSKDPQERLLGQTIERARENYKDLIKNGSEIIANRNAGNGGSPVLTVLPPGFDPSKETRVHTHYHGWNSTVADPKNHAHGLTNRIEAIQKKAGPQTVFVLPEAHNAKPGENRTNWGNVRSQADTTNQALRDAGVTNPSYRVVSAHSAGGQALQQSIQSDPKGRGLQADRLELLDSNYGSERSIANWANTEAGQKVRSVNYFHASNSSSDEGLRRAFANRYHRTNLGGHEHNRANTMIDTVPDL